MKVFERTVAATRATGRRFHVSVDSANPNVVHIVLDDSVKFSLVHDDVSQLIEMITEAAAYAKEAERILDRLAKQGLTEVKALT